MDHLNDMALFVEVVKARGFRGAAQALGMPNSTLSRRIGALERRSGCACCTARRARSS